MYVHKPPNLVPFLDYLDGSVQIRLLPSVIRYLFLLENISLSAYEYLATICLANFCSRHIFSRAIRHYAPIFCVQYIRTPHPHAQKASWREMCRHEHTKISTITHHMDELCSLLYSINKTLGKNKIISWTYLI